MKATTTLLELLLALWTLAGGGGGCSSVTAQKVPLYCSNNVYHWGNATSEPAPFITQVAEGDCEWDGLDLGPGGPGGPDNDSLDPTDPRMHWLYYLEAGEWEAINYVWTDDPEVEQQTWTWSGSEGVVFDAVAGGHYRVAVASDHSACVSSESKYYYTIRCPGTEWASYYSWVGGTPPVVTAVEDGVCHLEMFSAAYRLGVDPSVGLLDCYAEDVFSVWR
jgi:hypothetical protein